MARDLVLDRAVAVKMLKPQLAADPLVVERFRREAVAAARLNHPNIVTVYDTVSQDGIEAVVMELVVGSTLRQRLDDEGRLSVTQVVQLGVCLADALDATHRSGSIHCDLKPANVLLTPGGRVLITDFGVARPTDGSDESPVVALGTAKYLSPEQITGAPIGPTSDVYALGIVLFECLAGTAPFVGRDQDVVELAYARVNSDAPPVRTLRPSVPRSLAELVAECLDRDPAGRPSSAAEVRDRLVRLDGILVDDEPIVIDETPTGAVSLALATAGPPSPAASRQAHLSHLLPRRTGRFVTSLSMLSIVLAIAGGLLIASRTGPGGRILRSVRSGEGAGPRAARLTPSTTVGPASTTSVTDTISAGKIAQVVEFDPAPGDGTENPEQVSFLTDDRLTTTWSTVCYVDRTMLPKRGIGLVLELERAGELASLEVVSPTTGWSAEVRVASARPATLADWGPVVSSGAVIPAGTVAFPLGPTAPRYALLWVTQLGPTDQDCAFPWGITIADLRLTKPG